MVNRRVGRKATAKRRVGPNATLKRRVGRKAQREWTTGRSAGAATPPPPILSPGISSASTGHSTGMKRVAPPPAASWRCAAPMSTYVVVEEPRSRPGKPSALAATPTEKSAPEAFA